MKELLDLIKKTKEKGGSVFICGNGGSSATAEHFTNDLFSKGVKAYCLNSNGSIMTMIANDFGYDRVFEKQMAVYAKEGDLLVAISASGNSSNILRVLSGPTETITRYITFALLGISGGAAEDLADYSFVVDSNDYGKVEDEHLRIVHQIKDQL